MKMRESGSFELDRKGVGASLHVWRACERKSLMFSLRHPCYRIFSATTIIRAASVCVVGLLFKSSEVMLLVNHSF